MKTTRFDNYSVGSDNGQVMISSDGYHVAFNSECEARHHIAKNLDVYQEGAETLIRESLSCAADQDAAREVSAIVPGIVEMAYGKRKLLTLGEISDILVTRQTAGGIMAPIYKFIGECMDTYFHIR